MMKRINIDLMSLVLTIMGMGLIFCCIGCVKPYPEPIIQEIGTNETAFLVSLVGDTKDAQAKFDSISAIKEKKIATKQIEIPQRWLQTGRSSNSGRWIPSAKLIRVNRCPIARRWTPDEKSGETNKNQGLYAESKDSIGISSGFAITAYIKEEDAATYLYWFPSKSGKADEDGIKQSGAMELKDVIDSQVFTSAQAVYTAGCNKYDLNELRNKKEEITQKMRDELIPKFKEMGITIDNTMGLIGGLQYENQNIQEAIDGVFISQTLREKNTATKEAQDIENARLRSIADTKLYEAKKFAEAQEAQKAKIELEIAMLRANALLTAANKWDGKSPNQILPQGSSFLFGLDSNTK